MMFFTRQTIFLIAGLLLLLLGTSVPATSEPGDFLITGDSLGRAKLGQQRETVLRLYSDHQVKELDLLLEGLPAPALQIYQGNGLLLTAELSKGVVYRIGTTNPKFTTQEGIRVGSTFGDIKLKYGPPNFVGGGEGGLYAAFKVKAGTLSFLLDVEPDPLPKYLTDQSKVLKILVVQPPR